MVEALAGNNKIPRNGLPAVKCSTFLMATPQSVAEGLVLSIIQEPHEEDKSNDTQLTCEDNSLNKTLVSKFTEITSSREGDKQEYRLEMRDLCEDNQQHQLWIYRYDCIVNVAYPQIALQRCPETNKLVISQFSGAECQILNPQLISEEQETYKLVTEETHEVLLSSKTAKDLATIELAEFYFVA